MLTDIKKKRLWFFISK